MTIDMAQLEMWLTLPQETPCLEFKEAKTQFDFSRLCRYCVALSNEGGGHLVFGVSDKAPRRVVGSQACADPQGMAAKIFNTLGFRVDIHILNHPNGRVVVFEIPSRPAGTARHVNGAYLMRNGEELVPMSEDRLRAIFDEHKPEWLEEAAASDVSGQEVVHLLDTQSYFDLLGQPYPTTQEAVLTRLAEESLIHRQQDGYTISKLAALLIAKHLPAFPAIKRKAPRVVVYAADNKLDTISDITGEKGYAVGFAGLVGYVCEKLPHNQVITDALRHDARLLPDLVIRELLANALIHQDFTLGGMGPMVEVYQNRVEISNPGKPVIPPERFIDGYKSRNERLADLMRRFGICEEKSSGWDRVIATAETMQLPAPDILSGHDRTEVVIYGPRGFGDMNSSDRVRACYQHCVLQYIFRKPMNNMSLRARFGLNERQSNTASAVISATLEQQLIKADPSGPQSRKHVRYIPGWA